jgi:site-specific DNA-methyltransferase (adenine-specific)
MYSHHLTKATYDLVPILDMNTEWTDDKLAERYELTGDEIAFIHSKIRPYAISESDNEYATSQ